MILPLVTSGLVIDRRRKVQVECDSYQETKIKNGDFALRGNWEWEKNKGGYWWSTEGRWECIAVVQPYMDMIMEYFGFKWLEVLKSTTAVERYTKNSLPLGS